VWIDCPTIDGGGAAFVVGVALSFGDARGDEAGGEDKGLMEAVPGRSVPAVYGRRRRSCEDETPLPLLGNEEATCNAA
jgi:hypothetical protein